MDNYNYPEGADTSDAPWNEENLPYREIKVLVSVTLSKIVKVKVNDYNIIREKDEDNEYSEEIDYSECDLQNAVNNQIVLPQFAHKYIGGILSLQDTKKIRGDLREWNIDEIECMIDN